MAESSKSILVYNTYFFGVSETFIYQQVNVLLNEYRVELLARKYLNPHNYDISQYKTYTIERQSGFLNRVSNKLLKRNIFTFNSYRKLNQLFNRNKYDAIHVHYGTNALDILPVAKYYKIPLVVSFHGADASRMVKKKKYAEKLPALFDYARAIVISSRHMAENLNLDRWSEKVYLIPYGIDPANFNFQPPSKNGVPEKIKILHSGRIVGKKGVPDLIRVFRDLAGKYKHIELHLVGDGEELETCKALIEEFRLKDRVTFYGAVPHEKVKNMLGKADIFVLNSRVDNKGDMEGTPVTLLEAMCMGKAVVSTRHAGIPYVIKHKSNGLLAEERSNEELKKSIELLINDQKLRNQMGREAQKTIQASYTTKVMEEKLLRVFNNIIGN